MTIDPAIGIAAAVAVGLLLLASGVHKIVGGERFAEVLARYRALPDAVVPAAARAVPMVEIAAGIAALAAGKAGLLACCLLLVGYAGLILVTLARGIVYIDCGCVALGRRRARLRPSMAIRNTIVAAIGSLGLLPASGRAITLLDGLFIGLALVVVALLYIANDIVIQFPERTRQP